MSILNIFLKIINIIKSILITFTPIGTLYNYKKDYDKPFNFVRTLYKFIGFLFGLFAIYLSSICNENINYEIILALLFAPFYVGYKLFNDHTLCNILPPIFKFLGLNLLQDSTEQIIPILQTIPKVTLKETKPFTSPLNYSQNKKDTYTPKSIKIRSKSPVKISTNLPVKISTNSPSAFTIPLTNPFPKPYPRNL